MTTPHVPEQSGTGGVTGRYCGTHIQAPATFTGPAGAAWRIEMAPPGSRGKPDYDGTVGIYLVRAEGCHPLWDHWSVSVIHLRPMAGVEPAHIRVAGATHELVIAALDPGSPLPGVVADDAWAPRFLMPLDVVEQFVASSDAVADEILELAVRAIVDGHGSPDQDWRAWWAHAIGEAATCFSSGSQPGVRRLQ